MADEELEAIRRQRVAELQAKHGVRETEKETSKISLFNSCKLNRTCKALEYESDLSTSLAWIHKFQSFILNIR